MDDLLGEFLTETNESLDVIDVELVKFEQDPNNAEMLDNIFRLVHTIKGTCGFLGLPRLESLAHAAETLMGKYRDGAAVTPEGVTTILNSIDRIKEITAELEGTEKEPSGSDDDLISELERITIASDNAGDSAPEASQETDDAGSPEPAEQAAVVEQPAEEEPERDLKLGEVSADELERAFNEAPGPEDIDISAESAQAVAKAAREQTAAAAAPEPAAEKPKEAEAKDAEAKDAEAKDAGARGAGKKEGSVASQWIRVNVETLEHLMTMVGELVLTRNQLLEMVRRHNDSEFKVPLHRLSTVTGELQEGVMKTRMQPVGNAWQKLPRIIRDLSNELGKKIDLQMHGAETELDRQVLELIKDPLTHMVRNAADHGLEDTATRLQVGKPETGQVTLRAFHEGGHIIIEIADDGRGLDAEKIKAKALSQGLASEAELEQMGEQQLHKFIFHPGFSTAAQVTNVSGRGVGMDVVRTNIEIIGGNVDVKSTKGSGSTFSIKIPLTLAIVSALIVESRNQRFAIPQLSVTELVRTRGNAEPRIEEINGTPVLRLRNKLLPLITLSELLKLKSVEPESTGEAAEQPADESSAETDSESAFVVVIKVGAQSFGLVVDSIYDTEEIVVKPMSSMLRDVNMFSGNTILGDGSVIMIVDPNGIAQNVASVAGAEVEEVAEVARDEAQGAADTTALLLFRAGSGEPKAVPLSLVTRLEEVDAAAIEHSDGREVVQYRGSLMPLVHVTEDSKCADEGRQAVLVFTDERHSMGLVVDQIDDIVEDNLNVQYASDRPGMIGSAIIKERATEIVDVGHYLAKTFDDWLQGSTDTGANNGRRVLFVDDSAFFRNMLVPLLGAAGYDVTSVGSAEEALELRDDGERFDIIISDIEMPGMDGISFVQSVRGDARWSEVPIMALTNHNTPDMISKGQEAGVNRFIGKFDREGLIDSLRKCHTDVGVAA